MKKIDSGQLMQLLANVGVIGGIVFLGFELRQNTNAIRGTTIQEISSQLVDANFVGVDNAELRLAWRHAGSDSEQVTPAEAEILGWYYSGIMRILENRYRQARVGTIDLDAEQAFGFAPFFGEAHFRMWWDSSKRRYPDDFSTWVERDVIPRAAVIE